MAEVMATPKRDNSKGQRRVAVAKKADPGSRGRKTTILKGPGSNARVTPKLVESGVASPAKLVAALIAKVGSKKASQMIAKSKPTSNVKVVSNKTPKTKPMTGAERDAMQMKQDLSKFNRKKY
jgi:hypothetical protein